MPKVVKLKAPAAARARRLAPAAAPGVATARLLGLSGSTHALVRFERDGAAGSARARAAVALTAADVGRDVAVMFEQGDPDRPMIMGLLGPWPAAPGAAPASEPTPSEPLELDAEQIVLTAGRDLVLRCGKASITLTRAGKVILRGTYLSSRSSGVHRVKGGSVHIN